MKYVAYSYLFLFPIADYNRFSALFDHHPLSLLPAQILKNLLRDVDLIAPPPVFNYFSYVFVHNLLERSLNILCLRASGVVCSSFSPIYAPVVNFSTQQIRQAHGKPSSPKSQRGEFGLDFLSTLMVSSRVQVPSGLPSARRENRKIRQNKSLADFFYSF